MASDIDANKVADLCVLLANMATCTGDSVYLVKMLAVACATVIDGVQRPNESLEAAAGSLLLSTTAVCAAELEMNRDELMKNIGAAFDQIKAHMAACARRRLTLVPGGVA